MAVLLQRWPEFLSIRLQLVKVVWAKVSQANCITGAVERNIYVQVDDGQ